MSNTMFGDHAPKVSNFLWNSCVLAIKICPNLIYKCYVWWPCTKSKPLSVKWLLFIIKMHQKLNNIHQAMDFICCFYLYEILIAFNKLTTLSEVMSIPLHQQIDDSVRSYVYTSTLTNWRLCQKLCLYLYLNKLTTLSEVMSIPLH